MNNVHPISTTGTGKAISVTIHSVYGREVIRPACNDAHHFAMLIGQVTLTRRDITIIKHLGYRVNAVSTSPASL